MLPSRIGSNIFTGMGSVTQEEARHRGPNVPASADLEGRLAGLQRGFRADGYELQVDEVTGDHAAISIVPGPNACEDCLVPKTTLEAILLRAVDASGIRRITLRYPSDPTA